MLRLAHEGEEFERIPWSDAVWERFQAESAERSAHALVIVTVLSTGLLLAWSVGDFEYFPEHAMRFTCYRIATVIWCVGLAALAVKLRKPSAKLVSMWLWFLAWGAEGSAMIPNTPEHLLSHTFVLVIAQLGSLGFMIWSWKWGLTMSLAQFGMGELALSQVVLHGYETFAAHGYLITGVALCVLFTALKHQGAREQFDQRRRLQEEKVRSESLLGEMAAIRQERLTWLENLARFLRHELKNQIVAVGTSIDLAQSGESLTANQIYLERAQRSLARMRGLVSSATEATSLEAALAADEIERVDWSALVADRVLAFQELHPSHQLALSLRPGLFVQGNEERLAQLLEKLLSNAVEHAASDAEIRVELRRADDGWLELSVENDGDALPEDKERIFEAFVTSQKRPDNLGLGLFVARSIAQNHGGRITAEDLPERRGARFVVRLPAARQEGEDPGKAESQPGPVRAPRRAHDQPPQ